MAENIVREALKQGMKSLIVTTERVRTKVAELREGLEDVVVEAREEYELRVDANAQPDAQREVVAAPAAARAAKDTTAGVKSVESKERAKAAEIDSGSANSDSGTKFGGAVGAGIGAVVGGPVGAAVGGAVGVGASDTPDHETKSTVTGAVVGGAVGAAAGGPVGAALGGAAGATAGDALSEAGKKRRTSRRSSAPEPTD